METWSHTETNSSTESSITQCVRLLQIKLPDYNFLKKFNYPDYNLKKIKLL